MTLLLEGKTIGTRRAVSGVKPVITAAQRALAPRDVALERAAVEAYDELKGSFRDALFGALGRYRAEELTARELEQSWRASIREHWLQAYALGNRSEGYTAGLEDVDRTWLKGAWGEEYRYLGKFVQALDNDALNMPADDRLDMYVETLDGMFHAGRVDALPENVKIHWRLGAVRTEHCKGCLQLAAEGPYDKPGAGGPNPLWTTPRAGDTPCITGCRCSLVVEEIPAEEVPPRERTVPVARPEVDERIPAGFRAPGPSERAYIENLMSRIAFSRLALQDLQGDAKRQEILVRHRLAEELTKVLTANKLWVRPTWATGQSEIGESVSAGALEELFTGRELTPAGLDALHALDADRYQQLMDQYEARVLSKLALQKMSPALAQRAERIADLTALGLAGGAAAVLARRGREEPLALAADRRGEEEIEEAMQTGLPLREDATTSLNVAGAPGIGPGIDFKRARFLKGQKLTWLGLAWKVASVSFAPAPRRYVYVMVSETGQARIVSEAELEGVEVTGQLGREALMVMDGSLPVGVFIERALQEGGSGSGHFGHKGRKKLRGGSLPGVDRLTSTERLYVTAGQPGALIDRYPKLGQAYQKATGTAALDAMQKLHVAEANRLLKPHGVTVQNIVSTYTINDPGVKTRVTVKVEKSGSGQAIGVSVAATFTAVKGDGDVGHLVRTIDFQGKSVHHDSFFLANDRQGQGIGATMSRRSFELYRRMGLEEVSLLANGSVGGYAWALQGFDAKASKVSEWKSRAEGVVYRTLAAPRNLAGTMNPLAHTAYRGRAKEITGKLEHSWDVARLRIDGQKVGKEMLLGTDWHGTFDLKRGSPSDIVFKRYISETRKKLGVRV